MKSLLLSLLLTVSGLGISLPARAEIEPPTPKAETEVTKTPAPKELQDWVNDLDSAANSRSLKPYLKNYSETFRHADGFDRKQLSKKIQQFWSPYKTLTYETTIDQWQMKAPGEYTTQTTTKITGQKKPVGERVEQLSATLTTQQDIVNGKITNQSTLKEQSMLQSGANPPNAQINLPDTVAVGEDYFLDVIVQQPLGDRILLGAAIEEQVDAQSLDSPIVQLEPLSTGGLFKIGTAPSTPTDQWISAVLVQDGGTLIFSQRLSVLKAVEKTSSIP